MTTSADRVEGQSAYLLHSRPYRETSALVDLLSVDHGRIRAVVRGVRQPRSRKRELIRPFVPLQLSWHGRGELKTLRDGEACGLMHPLSGRALWCGLYLNELLVRLLPLEQPQPRLFALYRFSLEQLVDPEVEEAILRMFEKRLLEELGFGISFELDYRGEALDAAGLYQLDPDSGFVPSVSPSAGQLLYTGSVIRAIGSDDYALAEVRRAAKQLMRVALSPHLGGRPLQSRSLFQRAEGAGSRREAV